MTHSRDITAWTTRSTVGPLPVSPPWLSKHLSLPRCHGSNAPCDAGRHTALQSGNSAIPAGEDDASHLMIVCFIISNSYFVRMHLADSAVRSGSALFFMMADLPSLSLAAWARLSSALPWLPWVSSPAPLKPWEWSTCCRKGTCCHQPRSLPPHPASLRTCRKSTVTQSKLCLLVCYYLLNPLLWCHLIYYSII